jgi:glycosyltransferase involved in cell wall biosynthesis
LEAVPLLAARGANFHLVVIGDDTIFGPNGTTYREWFEARWPDHKKYVSFLGRVDDDQLRQEYANCDIFVAPSRFESFGLMLVEAMIFEKPVVCADIGGMSEIVNDGNTGVLVPPDDAQALAAALFRLIDSPELRVEMGQLGRKVYDERFTVNAMARGAERVYQGLRRSTAGPQEGAPQLSA